MKDKKKIEELIKQALDELDKLSIQYRMFEKGCEPYESTKKVLILLANELIQDSEINNRILRAMHDIGMSSYKDFENTKMEDLINKIVSILYDEIPVYKTLKPLRQEFGKGYPI